MWVDIDDCSLYRFGKLDATRLQRDQQRGFAICLARTVLDETGMTSAFTGTVPLSGLAYGLGVQ